MLSPSCNALMLAPGAEVGIPELELDEPHCCALAFDSAVVDVEFDESSGQLFLYARLGALPTCGASAICKQLLAGNLFRKETGEATLDREGNRVVLLQSLPAERLSEADFNKVAVEPSSVSARPGPGA
jgi:hypothetical protein